ncbi:GroES-like protein [Pilatotrama ljubarskyi]|nr:GroES-like protein [Pilatotrama ljubarskyi]
MSNTVPTTQKSLICYEESTPYVLGETPVPRPGPQDVLVKVLACALNPIDYAIVNPPLSRRLVRTWPLISGVDGAGVVVELGSEVSNLKVGDRILFEGDWTVPGGSTFQEYATVPADLTALVPDNITLEQAASIPLGLTTDVIVLYNQSPAQENLSLRLKPVWEPEGKTAYAGTPAFIIGGAASLGQYAIQLAKLAGHDPIITTASPHNEPLLKSLGATHVLDRNRSNESILAELPSLTGGKPIHYVFVAVPRSGGRPLALGRDALAPGGLVAIPLASPEGLPEDFTNPGDGKRVGYVFGSARLPYTRDISRAMFQQITGWLEKGLLKPNPVEVLPNGLAGISEGLARLKANKVSGTKLVARPQETP